MGKTGRVNRRYDADFKLCVILDMLEHRLCYGETVRKYWGKGQEKKYGGRLRLWERIYLAEGASGLMKERRGGKRTLPPGKVPKKAPSLSVEEELLAENQRLRMELDYLKKLSALVLADELAEGKKRKSSRN